MLGKCVKNTSRKKLKEIFFLIVGEILVSLAVRLLEKVNVNG